MLPHSEDAARIQRKTISGYLKAAGVARRAVVVRTPDLCRGHRAGLRRVQTHQQLAPRALTLRTLPWVLPRTGDRLPHDELISILGSGGIERVYPAHDWRLRRDVAVKVLTPEAAAKNDASLSKASFRTRSHRTSSSAVFPGFCELRP
jgi:hypothetical protein